MRDVYLHTLGGRVSHYNYERKLIQGVASGPFLTGVTDYAFWDKLSLRRAAGRLESNVRRVTG